jgi:ribosomal protein L21E
MTKKQNIRERGKLKLTRKFQDLKEGQRVAVTFDMSSSTNVPKRLQGRTGMVFGKRGSSIILAINDQTKLKHYIIDPIHLTKIK